jgi:hypothetical protein
MVQMAGTGVNILFTSTSCRTAKMPQKLVPWPILTAGLAIFSDMVDYLEW